MAYLIECTSTLPKPDHNGFGGFSAVLPVQTEDYLDALKIVLDDASEKGYKWNPSRIDTPYFAGPKVGDGNIRISYRIHKVGDGVTWRDLAKGNVIRTFDPLQVKNNIVGLILNVED